MHELILIMEDDYAINQLLTNQLIKEGFRVIQTYDGEEALEHFNDTIDLVVLDMMVPKKNGIDVMKAIRQQSSIPLLFLTARDEDVDKILALGLGADDYITKPFSMIEVVYRIKAHLRRYYEYNQQKNNKSDILLSQGDLVLNTLDFTLKKGEVFIELSVKEFELITLFMRHAGQVFTKHQLYEKVWGETFYGDDNTVMVHISKLREKLGDSSKNAKYIKTIKGLGYRMEQL